MLLLRDIRAAFNTDTRLKTSDLLQRLYAVEESPWGDWYGKQLSPHGLSRLLKPYRIKTMPVWIDGETARGYKAEQFADAFARVLAVRSVSGVSSRLAPQAAPNSPNAPNSRDGSGGVPLPGDDDYPEWIDAKCHEGHLTEAEWIDRRKLHALVAAL